MIDKKNEAITRDELLLALYGTTSKQELLKAFGLELSVAKGSSKDKYTHLLEQILYFSHAIIYGHRTQTAHNYRQSFMNVANKTFNGNKEDIRQAFSFLNRTERKAIGPIAPIGEATKDKDSCGAKKEIVRLKEQLESDSYETTRGQKKEDKEIYIKIAIVALATGARLKEITETMKVSTAKGIVTFINDKRLEEGVIIEIDAKVVRGYLKDIQEHYRKRVSDGKDISTGIRKSILGLNIFLKGNHTTRNIKNPDTKEIRVIEYRDVALNLNDLNSLYNECIV